MAEKYRFPCGVVDEEGSEPWVCEISCTIVGCKNCKNFNGTEFYERNVKKGIASWAKRQKAGQ